MCVYTLKFDSFQMTPAFHKKKFKNEKKKKLLSKYINYIYHNMIVL